jgi:hypothetical protein
MRIVYSQPISGRQVIQLRLERNQALGSQNWALPRVEVVGAKSVRGNIGVSADTGFRLTPERTQGLTEIATAFFPRKLAGLQTGFRLSEPAWQATMRVERLPQTVQADAFNLFSIGEGIAYGSTVMNFLISGAPISAFQVELSDEYFNVEFIGKEIRTWQKTTNGYMVQLHAPVSGAYVLLATYERPFKPQGETLLFTGARPRDAQTEQGYTIVISAHQFQVKPVQVSQGLLPLEPGEVPAEYRLFFDAPILAAYRYTSRPFDLRLALSPLAQGDSLSQVVDRASLVTRISKEGQAVTDVAYLVKNRGNPNLRISLPANTELWSATVNGAPVVPVKDGNANLIPLPQHADPDAVLKVELKLAAKSPNPSRVRISAPIVDKAPVMLAEWKVQPDTGQRLIYRKGSLTPPGGVPDVSGFGVLARLFGGGDRGLAVLQLLVALGLLAITLALWRWLIRERVARFSGRHLAGLAFGVVALLVAAFSLAQFVMLADGYRAHVQPNLALVAPIQQSGGDLHVEVANVPATTGFSVVRSLWPVLAVVVIWIIGRSRLAESFKPAPRILCWTLLAWVVLQLANGVPWFIGIVCAFFCLDLLIPLLRQLWTLPSKELPPLGSNAASAGTAILTGSLLLLSLDSQTASAADAAAAPAIQSIVTVQDRQPSPLAQSVAQEIRVEDGFAMATAKIRWRATKGQELPVLFGPAVVTRITFPSDALKSGQTASDDKRIYQLTALQSGTFEIELEYQLRVATQDAGGQFELPTQFGLVNPVKLTVVGRKVDVFSAQAASVQGETSGTNTVVTLALSPVNGAIISWKPRSRDVAREKPVYYAELTQLYIPSAGVIEGVHLVSIRPAQGELPELTLDVPPGATITDVTGSTLGRVTIDAATGTPVQAKSLIVSVWRFDPDTRKLRVTLNPAQSKPFALVVRSQVATGPLPFEHKVGLLSVEGTSGQIGFLGVATGNEVQLDSVSAEDFSPINLEDFPSETVRLMAAPIPGLTVRRAYRFTAVKSMAMVKASAVEPDVRVETQDTLSLGEDRIVLASSATVDITRAGIFRLSFIMPDGFDVDSITGPALSHWADQKTDAGRLITLNLKGKTEGRQQFTISLAGPGFRATNNWSVPRVVLREASKQQGTYLIVPEQGMQLQASGLDNVSQLDPQRAGIRQKGVLAFRVLQSPWKLVVQVEQVDSWVQVTSLQHATVNEAQVKVAVNLQYQIENTGLKLLRVFIPTNAESVRFVGEHVSDFLPVAGAVTNGLQEWEIKLQRRIIGQYLLQATYQTPLPAQTPNTTLLGVQAADVNLQRGYVTVQSSGRLQVRVDSLPTGLQPIEWQSIPRGLQQNLQADAANFAYRLVEPSFQLPLNLDRHEATRLLPARVNSITFDSVISDAGVMLTQVRLEMLPGDKRLLYVNLPKDAKFWFAFVNRSGVWPWRDQDEILIPLEPQSRGGKPVPVEFFYSSQVGKPGSHAIDLTLLAPKFDLPLENITWRVYLGEKWQVKHWTGNLQLQQEQLSPVAATLDFDTYLKSEANLQKEKTQEAEQMLALGNTALERGDPQQARRAFQAAFGLSTHDNAFNEDARVQLHNLKLQQALVGLNVRQAAAAGDGGTISSRFREMRGAKNLNYTQQDAKEILDRNTSDDNAAYVRLAEKLIQQQDAAVTSPSAIRANIPEQGRRLTFHRSVAVDKDADLRIGLNATISRSATWTARVSILLGTLVVVGLFVRLGGGRKRVENARPGLVA